MNSRIIELYKRFTHPHSLDYRDTETRRCIEVSNLIMTLSIFVCGLLALVFLAMGNWPIALLGVGAIGNAIIALTLNYRGQHVAGRSFFFVSSNALIVVSQIIFGFSSGTHLYFIAGLAMAPAFFGRKERLPLYGFVLLNGIEFILAHVLRGYSGIIYPLEPEAASTSSLLQHTGAVLLVATSTVYYIRISYNQFQEIEGHRFRLLQYSRADALKEISGGVAHEINNPLSIIQGRVDQSLQLLAEFPPRISDLNRYMVSISSMVQRVSRIVKALQELGTGDERSPYVWMEIKEIVAHALNLCADRFQSEGIELKLVDHHPELKIFCRPTEITQIIMSLLTNAYEATRFSAEKWVRINIEANGDLLNISVTDSGPGVPREFAERIMEPFFSTKLGPARGLGLAIARTLANGHQGQIHLNTSSEHTQLILTLPKNPRPITNSATAA